MFISIPFLSFSLSLGGRCLTYPFREGGIRKTFAASAVGQNFIPSYSYILTTVVAPQMITGYPCRHPYVNIRRRLRTILCSHMYVLCTSALGQLRKSAIGSDSDHSLI